MDLEPQLDAAALDSLWGLPGEEGGDVLGELIDIFADQSRLIIASLTRVSSVDDCDEARRVAHRLKGSALTLGARDMAAVAWDAESAADRHEADRIPALAAQLADLCEPTISALRAAREAIIRRSAQSS